MQQDEDAEAAERQPDEAPAGGSLRREQHSLQRAARHAACMHRAKGVPRARPGGACMQAQTHRHRRALTAAVQPLR